MVFIPPCARRTRGVDCDLGAFSLTCMQLGILVGGRGLRDLDDLGSPRLRPRLPPRLRPRLRPRLPKTVCYLAARSSGPMSSADR